MPLLRIAPLVPAGVALVTSLAAAPLASACSCFDFNLVAPADGAKDVPPNAKLWDLGEYSHGNTRHKLIGPEGAVPLSSAYFMGPTRWGAVSTPAKELTPGARYQFVGCPEGKPCATLSSFEVGTKRAEKPALPVEEYRSPRFRKGEPSSGTAALLGVFFLRRRRVGAR